MRPVVVNFIKCRQCNSEKLHKLTLDEYIKVENYERSNFEFMSEKIETPECLDFLLDVQSENRSIELTEGDIYEGNKDKIYEFLFGCDVIKGSLYCPDCSKESLIENGILNCIN
ncbi:hypothetical protein HERIO_1291 [Hepatospora eriocheir]|uniref:Uncharacterized protein n=1 Tax=Hepatospora eriocheir TaxID=1081669 RepID=A0A1X0QAN0_9MICR|nr:hypothetical protein HERIO_1291 [Hepatospora eriocheir]